MITPLLILISLSTMDAKAANNGQLSMEASTCWGQAHGKLQSGKQGEPYQSCRNELIGASLRVTQIISSIVTQPYIVKAGLPPQEEINFCEQMKKHIKGLEADVHHFALLEIKVARLLWIHKATNPNRMDRIKPTLSSTALKILGNDALLIEAPGRHTGELAFFIDETEAVTRAKQAHKNCESSMRKEDERAFTKIYTMAFEGCMVDNVQRKIARDYSEAFQARKEKLEMLFLEKGRCSGQ